MIYVPEYNSSMCAYIYNTDIIRVYQRKPQNNSTIAYKDYYLKSSYIFNEGSTTFSQYATLPTCIQDSRMTTEVYYRNDFPHILWMFIALCIIFFWFPLKLFSRIFRRWSL